MSEWLFDVILHTAIGKRIGMFSVEVAENIVRGEMKILNHIEQVEGTVDADGNCRLDGFLHTLSREIPFTATGNISETSLKLTLQGAENTYYMTGLAVKKEENQ